MRSFTCFITFQISSVVIITTMPGTGRGGRPGGRGIVRVGGRGSQQSGRGRGSLQAGRGRGGGNNQSQHSGTNRPGNSGFIIEDEIDQPSVSPSPGVVVIEDDDVITGDNSTQHSDVSSRADTGQAATDSESVTVNTSKVPGVLQYDQSNVDWSRSMWFNFGYYEKVDANKYPDYVR